MSVADIRDAFIVRYYRDERIRGWIDGAPLASLTTCLAFLIDIRIYRRSKTSTEAYGIPNASPRIWYTKWVALRRDSITSFYESRKSNKSGERRHRFAIPLYLVRMNWPIKAGYATPSLPTAFSSWFDLDSIAKGRPIYQALATVTSIDSQCRILHLHGD